MKTSDKFLLVLLVVFLSITCLGCGKIDDDIYGKKKVIEEVDSICFNEDYSIVNILKEDSSPKKDTYYFKSNERELEFTAISTRYKDSAFGYYHKKITCDYSDAVRNIYKERIDTVLSGISEGVRVEYDKYIVIDRFDEISGVVDAIKKVSDIYKEELEFNNQKWLDKNPYVTFHVCSDPIDGKGREVFEDIAINGCFNKDVMLHAIQLEYAQAVVDGRINSDDTVPWEIEQELHRSEISEIYINGELLTYEYLDDLDDTKYNTDYDIYTMKYDYKYDDYLVTIDAALAKKDVGPHSLIVYINKIGTSGEVNYRKGFASWEINHDKYTLEASQNDDTVDAVVKKNGEDLNIDFIQYLPDKYMVKVTLGDFCKMMNLSAKIDEKSGAIYLTSRD